jgi:hypothetical protein
MPAQLAHHLVELAVEVDAGMRRPFRRRQAEQIFCCRSCAAP